MKKILINNFNSILPDLSSDFEILDGTTEDRPDLILTWNDVLPEHRRMIETAQVNGIPCAVMQHGVYGDKFTEYEAEQKQPLADMFFAFGPGSARSYTEAGWPKEKVIMCGCPMLDYALPWEPEKENPIVVFTPVHAIGYSDADTWMRMQAIDIWEKILTMEGIRPVIKLIEKDHPVGLFRHKDLGGKWKSHGEAIFSERGVKYVNEHSAKHPKIIFDLLSKAACTVVQFEDTFAMLAHSQGIPCIKAKNGYPLRAGLCTESELDTLPDLIREFCSDPTKTIKPNVPPIEYWLQPFNRLTMVDALNNLINRYQFEEALT